MPTQKQLDQVHIRTALNYASLSKAKRKQVGAVMVTSSGIMIPGYNGTPIGMDNECETWQGVAGRGGLVTKPDVLHGELNCLIKAAREGVSCLDATMYITLSPCIGCSAMMINAGIKRVVFLECYRDTTPIDYLRKAGIIVEQFVKE